MVPEQTQPLFIVQYAKICYSFQIMLTRIKGIRDAGSTADFRILFEALKLKKNWKVENLENLENFGTFGKF